MGCVFAERLPTEFSKRFGKLFTLGQTFSLLGEIEQKGEITDGQCEFSDRKIRKFLQAT
jgi:hypothetical protein